MFGFVLKDGKLATPTAENTVMWTRKATLTVAFLCAAASILGVAYVRAQSFPRESQFISRRNSRDDGTIRADVIDDIRDRLYQQSQQLALLDARVASNEHRLGQIESIKPDVVVRRLDEIVETQKDDRSERLWLRGALVTTFSGMIVVLFSSWWTRRNGAPK